MLPKSSVICKALPVCTQTQMFLRRFFHEAISSLQQIGEWKVPWAALWHFRDRHSFPEILWISWPSQHQDFHISPHTVSQQYNTNTGQPWQCPLCPTQPLSQLSWRIRAQHPGYSQCTTSPVCPHSPSTQPFPSAALLETHPIPQLVTNPKWPVGDLPVPLGALSAHKGFSPQPPCQPNAN